MYVLKYFVRFNETQKETIVLVTVIANIKEDCGMKRYIICYHPKPRNLCIQFLHKITTTTSRIHNQSSGMCHFSFEKVIGFQ